MHGLWWLETNLAAYSQRESVSQPVLSTRMDNSSIFRVDGGYLYNPGIIARQSQWLNVQWLSSKLHSYWSSSGFCPWRQDGSKAAQLCGEHCKQPGNKATILHATYDFTNLVSPQFPSFHHSQELPIAQLTITCRTDYAHTVVPVWETHPDQM